MTRMTFAILALGLLQQNSLRQPSDSLALFPDVQTASAASPAADPQLESAQALIGRALFLRCFCSENNLAFDAEGHAAAEQKTTDWTLAGVNLDKVERKSTSLVQLEGVRVASRFNPERREFERHPQKDERLRLTVSDTGDPRQFRRALEAIFAQGIDPALQHSMPAWWAHYFHPGLPWPADALTGQSVYVPGPAGQALSAAGNFPVATDPTGPAVSPPAPAHRSEAAYTPEATRDRVKGGVLLRVIVDAQGQPQRIQILRPLGYGLDERAVESLKKFRFNPALREGRPVASLLVVNQDFVVPAP